MTNLFDFSETKVGDKLTRVMYNLWINEAIVTELTEDTITCEVLVDTYRVMVFNRNTGVVTEGKQFGLLVNRSGEGQNFVENLKVELHDALSKPLELPTETAVALREHLSHDW